MQVIYLKPVQKFLVGLEPMLKAKVLRHIDMLIYHAMNLSMPFSKRISKDLYELRILGVVNVRIFYTIKDAKIWLLHGFIKTTHKIPRRHLDLGYKRLKDLI